MRRLRALLCRKIGKPEDRQGFFYQGALLMHQVPDVRPLAERLGDVDLDGYADLAVGAG